MKKQTWFQKFIYSLKYHITKWLWKTKDIHYPTKEDWKTINKIDWDEILHQAHSPIEGHIPDSTKDRFLRNYSTYSPVDMKVYLVSQEDNLTRVFTMNGLSFKYTNPKNLRAQEPEIQGSLICTFFNRSSWDVLKEAKHLYLYANNEYGYISRCDFLNIELKFLTYGLTIDDIVTTEIIEFTAMNFIPWRKVEHTAEYLRQRVLTLK